MVPATKPIVTLKEDWDKLDSKMRSMIFLSLSNSLLLSDYEEEFTKKLWERLGNLYESKSLVNQLFL